MLLYTKTAPAKVPKRRSRAGCIHCKEKKKKCNEGRPQCDRCIERNLTCEYEPVKPRKRRRISTTSLATTDDKLSDGPWSPTVFDYSHQPFFDQDRRDSWVAGVQGYSISQEGSSVYGNTSSFAGDDDDDDEDIETIPRDMSREQRRMSSSALVRTSSAYPDLAMIAPSPVASPLLEFCAPAYEEFTHVKHRRHLIDHFCNTLSHLIVLKEDRGNPFRQLVLPLAQNSQPVLNAIFALSSAHLEYRGIGNGEKSLDFHNQALQGLAQLINQNGQAHTEEVLGAIMLLIYYEVLVRRGDSNIVTSHLRGALTVMQSQPAAPTPTSVFLERAFRFYDVIAALSFGSSPVASAQLPSLGSNGPMDFNESFGSIDALLGMATDLWPVIHRLSNLLEVRMRLQAAEESGNTSKALLLRTELDTSASSIEISLTEWAPAVSPSVLAPGQDPAAHRKLQSIIHNAEAYRHAALVYLYRCIKRFPRQTNKVQIHTKQALHSCFEVVTWGGPMGALLWPLFVASCEAVTPDDRAIASLAYSGIENRQGMVNISRAWGVVEEVWQKVDALGPESNDEVDWREIARSKGVDIVFG